MKLSREDARGLLWGSRIDGVEVELDEQINSLRWVSIHRLVVKDKDGRFWETTYQQGLTESQDTSPFEHEEEVTFYEVVKMAVTSYRYIRLGKAA